MIKTLATIGKSLSLSSISSSTSTTGSSTSRRGSGNKSGKSKHPGVVQLNNKLKREKRFRLVANLAFFITEKEHGIKATMTTRVTSVYSRLSEVTRALCLESYDLAIVFILLQKYYRASRTLLANPKRSNKQHVAYVASTAGHVETHILAAVYIAQTMLYDQPLRKTHWGNLVRRRNDKDAGYVWLVEQALSFSSVIEYDFGGVCEDDLIAAHLQLIGPIENRALAAYQYVENQALLQRKAAGKAKKSMGRPTVMDIF